MHFHVSQLIYEEFWAQGDLELSRFGDRPAPMMDRDASLAIVQLDFIDGVCSQVYDACAAASRHLAPLVQGLQANRRRWKKEEEEEEPDKKAPHNARNL